jgi:hypothetical protein
MIQAELNLERLRAIENLRMFTSGEEHTEQGHRMESQEE